MHFIQFDYLLIFLPLVLVFYFLFRTSPMANVVIMGASYYFYGSAGLFYVAPLIFTSVLDFLVGRKIEASQNERARFFLLILSIVANLGLLFFFKYATWAMESTNWVMGALGLAVTIPVVLIPLPPGISFYTFQTMSYTIEIYQRHMKASRNIVDYMAFVTFWPHLVAGPIMRAKNLLGQLEKVRPIISAPELRFALLLIAWGLTKKLVLADNFGHIVDSIDSHVTGGYYWSGAGLLYSYAFAGQIYCDFSAYTSIARGSAKLIGIELVQNFKTPYFAVSPSEFWRRWHISLSTWLRDYLYFSLGGNRQGRLREYLNLMITMVLGGLWHGAGMLFLAWGAWHGFLLVLYRRFPIDQMLITKLGIFGKPIAIFLMFNLVCIGWLLFRANTTTIMPLLGTIAMLFSKGLSPEFTMFGRGIAVLGAVLFITDWLGYRNDGEFEDLMKSFSFLKTFSTLVICYVAVVLFAKRDGAQFIYFQF
jgi:alginate O-acetyltransferase complex protein AlgI